MNQTSEQKFTTWLEHLCLRPAMYLGVSELSRVEAFLWGFCFGFDLGNRNHVGAIGGWDFLSRFMSVWLRGHFQVNHPAWGFSRILLHHYNHDEQKAIRAIPELFKLYTESSFNSYEWMNARIHTVYGKDHGAPDCDQCEMISQKTKI